MPACAWTSAAPGSCWAALIGVPLGCYSTVRRNSALDKLTGVLSVATISIPSFVVAIYAILLFAIHLDWFPIIGAGEPRYFSAAAPFRADRPVAAEQGAALCRMLRIRLGRSTGRFEMTAAALARLNAACP